MPQIITQGRHQDAYPTENTVGSWGAGTSTSTDGYPTFLSNQEKTGQTAVLPGTPGPDGLHLFPVSRGKWSVPFHKLVESHLLILHTSEKLFLCSLCANGFPSNTEG